MIRVIGLGQPARGDDGVGPAVIAALQEAPPAGVELITLTDTAALIDLLDGTPTILVDAVAEVAEPGAVLELTVADLAGVSAVSTHGIGVPEALGLAEALHGPAVIAGLQVVGVAITGDVAMGRGLSEAVAAAVPVAAARIREML